MARKKRTIYRTTKVVNGVCLAVTNHSHAQYLGFEGDSGDGSGPLSALQVGFSKSAQELYVKAYIPNAGHSTYHLLESAVGELHANGVEVGDDIPLENFFGLLNGGHLYTHQSGLTAPVDVEDDETVGVFDFGPDVRVVEVVETAESEEDDEDTESLTSQALRMMAAQHFSELLIALAHFQQSDIDLDEIAGDGQIKSVPGTKFETLFYLYEIDSRQRSLLECLNAIVDEIGLGDAWKAYLER